MQRASLERLNEARRTRRAVVLLTDLGNAREEVVIEGEKVPAGFEEPIAAALQSGKSGLVESHGRSYFLNVHLPSARIIVIGAVHISQALAGMAAIAGFPIRIIDPRTAFATAERFAGVDLVADWPEDVLKSDPLDAYTALVAVTHDPKIDDFPLGQALKAGCFYVGALGSRKTHAKRVERLAAAGFDDAAIARIAAPIGLNIGASSPAEIAVAILAQIIRALRKRDVMSPAGDAR
ncbi:XdhC family protein [Rhizobiaceae bacterium n13]|uniref:XdhC family protein n=1 Tax=Ferirhizobium litorale TaxID=2927786 RepID=A0AAE3QGW9_9HYPH|nr:XdhC family protein [Fererhizobium litorale]MDI7863297.1 XdhC family protein [Fererhizobium litorale]MDI7922969.1 XdhC family protein [Fererhizobium litorale]